MFDLRNRVEQTCNLAHENLLSSQQTYKRHFDKKASLRILEVDDQVLVMLRTDHNKLLLRWKGPYKIAEKVGVTDYRIKVGNRLRLFHVNMLRMYTEREPTVCAITSVLDSVDCPELKMEVPGGKSEETFHDVVSSTELDSIHSDQLQSLVQEFGKMFSDVPGLTNLEEHAIQLTSTKPIRRKPYPTPYSKVGEIEMEVKKMLALGVIEPYKSPFCSPLLLVKKSDGSFRPVVDFRQLNQATVFDAEPMPNPEEIYAKLAKDKLFSTFDFCKGYWQIAMRPAERDKTAFSSTLGLFQFRRMPFGLVNAGATYARMMRSLIEGTSARRQLCRRCHRSLSHMGDPHANTASVVPSR